MKAQNDMEMKRVIAAEQDKGLDWLIRLRQVEKETGWTVSVTWPGHDVPVPCCMVMKSMANMTTRSDMQARIALALSESTVQE